MLAFGISVNEIQRVPSCFLMNEPRKAVSWFIVFHQSLNDSEIKDNFKGHRICHKIPSYAQIISF